jgi:hypothetical protein
MPYLDPIRIQLAAGRLARPSLAEALNRTAGPRRAGGASPRAAPNQLSVADFSYPQTNLLERAFVEVRRRTKVIGRFPGETQRSRSSGPCWSSPAAAGAA